ncbi:unnamed protein product [Malus baccata var. baccata]
MSYSTANFTSSMFNNLPAIAFFMAVIFRIEKVRKLHSQAKYSWSHRMGKKKDKPPYQSSKCQNQAPDDEEMTTNRQQMGG